MEANFFQTLLAAKVGPLPLLLVMALLLFGLPAVSAFLSLRSYNKKNDKK